MKEKTIRYGMCWFWWTTFLDSPKKVKAGGKRKERVRSKVKAINDMHNHLQWCKPNWIRAVVSGDGNYKKSLLQQLRTHDHVLNKSYHYRVTVTSLKVTTPSQLCRGWCSLPGDASEVFKCPCDVTPTAHRVRWLAHCSVGLCPSWESQH